MLRQMQVEQPSGRLLAEGAGTGQQCSRDQCDIVAGVGEEGGGLRSDEAATEDQHTGRVRGREQVADPDGIGDRVQRAELPCPAGVVSSKDGLAEGAGAATAGDDEGVISVRLPGVEVNFSAPGVDGAHCIADGLHACGWQSGLVGFEQADGHALVHERPIGRLFAAAGEEIDVDAGT